MSLKEKGHQYAKRKTTMISLVAGTLGPSCAKNLPLEDPLVPIHVSLSSKGWQPDGQWAHDPPPRQTPAEVSCCRPCPDRRAPSISLSSASTHSWCTCVRGPETFSLLSPARAGALPHRITTRGLGMSGVQGRPGRFLLVEDRRSPD